MTFCINETSSTFRGMEMNCYLLTTTLLRSVGAVVKTRKVKYEVPFSFLAG